ncbi:VCBS domain-containing protein, partial [Vibrio tapetis subsp. quintayensis]|uniref:VCBS domain-containing protein n=1 Tax=Vibrio tapetis TaxID=52443 RepID=UPI0025B4C687
GLTFNSDGSYSFDASSYDSLSKDETLDIVVPVTVTDEAGGTGITTLTITITGTNDDPVANIATADVLEDAILNSVVTASDVDLPSGSNLTFTTTSTATGLTFNSDGSYTFDASSYDSLSKNEKLDIIVPVTVTDESGGTDTTLLTITITGTNDDPVAVAKVDAVVEDSMIAGHVTASDVDLPVGNSLSFTTTSTAAGLTLNTDGSYIFDASSYDFLSENEILEVVVPVTVTDEAGGTDTTTLTITVTGTNDSATVSSVNKVLAETDAALTSTGTLTSDDVDNPDNTFTPATVSGPIGTLTLLSNGNWSFLANSAFDSMQVGDEVRHTFNITSIDGTPSSVEIIIQGTNDAPVINSAVGVTGSLEEDTPSYQTTGTLVVSDPDHDVSSDMTWTNLTTGTPTYGSFSLDANGKWTYVLNNNDTVVQSLSEGQFVTDTFTIQVSDGDLTDTQVVTVTIKGDNDTPVITSGVTSGATVEDVTTVATGQLVFDDIDLLDTLSWAVNGGGTGTYGDLSIDQNGLWTYTLVSTRVDSLHQGEVVSESFTVRLSDNHGGFVEQVINLTVTGTNDLPAVTGDVVGVVEEDTILSVDGTIVASDADVPDSVTMTLTSATDTPYGLFSFNPSTGKWVYTLDNAEAQKLAENETVTEIFNIKVADTYGGITNQSVTITIKGDNDQPTISGDSSGNVKEDTTYTATGTLAVADVDVIDDHSWSVSGGGVGNFGSLSIDANGEWTYNLNNGSNRVQRIGEGDTKKDFFTIIVDDGKGGTDTQLISITITGTNDAPRLRGSRRGDVTEDGTLSVTKQLYHGDKDVGDTHTWTVVSSPASSLGTFVLSATGKWTFTLNNGAAQHLDAGDKVIESYQVKVEDQEGASKTKTVKVSIFGTNDIPTLEGDLTGDATEDIGLIVTGVLTDGDVDADDTHVYEALNPSGRYGELVLTPAGDWTYTLDNTKAQVQALADSETLTETFRVTVEDSHGAKTEKNIVVTINGNNDDPTITGPNSGTVIEAVSGQQETSGKLVALDVDTTDSHSWKVQTGTGLSGSLLGTYGTLSIDETTGMWTYTLDSTKTETVALDAGEVVNDPFTIEVSDGNGGTDTQVITINVVGTNTSPLIVGDETGTITELVGTGVSGVDNKVIGQLDSGDPDGSDSHDWLIVEPTGTYGTMSIDVNGKWTFVLNDTASAVNGLDNGDIVTDTFTVQVSDSFGQVSTAQVEVTITGTNDAPTLVGSNVTGTITEDGATSVSGKLKSGDPDVHDTSSWSIDDATGVYGNLIINSAGVWTYTVTDMNAPAIQALSPTTSITETFTVTVTDSAGLTASKNVVVTIQGTNDKPTLGGDTTATFEEDVTASPLSGTITSADIDTDVASGTDTDAVDTVKFIGATITGNLGTLTISDAGVWSYVVDNNSENVQGLREGETHTEVFNVHAFDEFGGVVNQPLTITIQGTNDLPIVLGEDTGRVAKDSTWETTQGMVYATDVDVLDTVSEWNVSPVDGSYGQLTIDSNGIWTFVLDDSKPAASGLVAGDSATDTFYVTAKDTAGGVSATYPVVITVLGADDGTGPGGGGTPNDQPSVTGQISGSVTEDALTSESGQLLVDDNDNGDSHTWSLSADTDGDNIVQGLYGHLELNPITGRWDYILDNNNATVQALDHGETLQDTFSVEVKDSSGEANDTGTQTITIDIKGTADDVEISDPVVETVNVTEDTDISKSGTLVAPAELGAPAWHLASGAGDYGTLTLNESGDWTYNLNSSVPAVDQLNVGESLTEIFEVVVVDEFGKTTVDSNGDPVKMQINVVVNGSNDGPNITGELAATISNTDDDSQIVGNLNDGDVDATDTHTWSLPDETTANEQNGTYGKLILDPVTGQYRYELDKSIDAVKNLGETETLTDIFNVKVVDALGLESVKPVTITIAGSNLEPVITGDLTGDSVEDTAVVTTGNLVAVESNTDDTASFIAKTASGGNALQGTYGQFEITSDGDWTYSLYNTQPHVQELSPSDIVTESFIVTAVDSFGVTTRETVTIEIKGTNDRPEVSGDSTGVVSETQTLTATGNLVTSDLDESDSHSYSVTTSASYGALVVNPTTGVWIYTIDSDNVTVNSLAKGSSITDTAIITVMDAFGGTDTISVDITINGENDAPEISGNLTADANEDTNTMLTGQLETGDPDVLQTADTHKWTLLSNTSPYGDMSLDQNGKWSFNLTNTHSDIQALGNGESIDITYQVKVTDQHNVSHTQDVTITVNGTNDLPIITGPTTGSVVEDGTATQQGNLDFTDIDVNDSHTWDVQGGGAGTYGSLTVDANGQWTYTLANSSPAVQGLAQGQTEQDTFTITLFDGTDTVTKEVTIDVSGSNDLPSISGDTSTSTTQDAVAHVGGSLSAVDTDTNDTHTWTIVGSAEGQYGHFVLNQLTGNWEYQIDNTLPGSDALGQGETDSELFVVQVSDPSGATKNQTVSIEVTGRNDAPQITSVIAAGNAIVGYTTQALGSFTASDADSNNTDLVWSIVDQEGTYGTLSIDQTGAWTYNIDESKPGATSLNAGSSGQEIFTIQVTDTHGAVTQETVTIDVDGAFYDGVVTIGADILTGTANNEVMFGDPLGSSAGPQDTFVWLSGSLGLVNGLPGRDIIREFDATNDSIDISGIVSADSLANLNALTSSISLVESGSDVLLSINDGSGVIQAIEFESMNLNTLLDYPNASALSSADQIIRMLGNGTLKVSEHIGDDSANSVTGTGGSDSLYGLKGDDFLTGGEGDDILTGGSGNDIFIWHQGETNSVAGHDEVSDFELAGGDKLDFRDILPDAIDGTDLTNLLTHVNASIGSDNETIELVVTPETGLTQTIDVHVGDVGAFGLSGVSSSADIVSELLSRDAFKWD